MTILTCLLILGSIASGQSVCPEGCDCTLDDRGRRQVVCAGGGMTDPIPINHMDPAVSPDFFLFFLLRSPTENETV